MTSKPWASRKLVQVEWSDAFSSPGWVEVADALATGDKIIYTVGYLLAANSRRVTLFMSQSENDSEVGNVMVIPRAMVRRIVKK